MIRPGAATEMLRRLATAPAPGDWYALPDKELGFSRKSGKRPFILGHPLLGPVAYGFVRTRQTRDAAPEEHLPGSTAARCRTPRGPGILHPPHEGEHERGCGLTDHGLVPLWFLATIPRSLLDASTRRCREPDRAVVAVLRQQFSVGPRRSDPR